jgi:recombination DNA repair RAD52 pathway protein
MPQYGSRVELNAEQIGALMSDLNKARVKTRNVSGSNQSYVEAWDVKATLVRVFGFGGFSVDVIEAKILDIRDDGRQGQYPPTHPSKANQNKTPYVMAYARVRLTIHGIGPQGQDVTYTEASIGTNDGFTIGDVADNAIKSAASDALKRCAIFLGTQFGLSLYNSGSTADIVRVILEPEQKAMLEAYRSQSQPPQSPQQEFNEGDEANFARALGATRIEETVEPGVAADDGSSTGAQMAEEQS